MPCFLNIYSQNQMENGQCVFFRSFAQMAIGRNWIADSFILFVHLYLLQVAYEAKTHWTRAAVTWLSGRRRRGTRLM